MPMIELNIRTTHHVIGQNGNPAGGPVNVATRPHIAVPRRVFYMLVGAALSATGAGGTAWWLSPDAPEPPPVITPLPAPTAPVAATPSVSTPTPPIATIAAVVTPVTPAAPTTTTPPTVPTPTPPPTVVKVELPPIRVDVHQPRTAEPPPITRPRSDAEQRNEALKERLRNRYRIS